MTFYFLHFVEEALSLTNGDSRALRGLFYLLSIKTFQITRILR
jgi:hypothetical protein